jgi:hypothetical protein
VESDIRYYRRRAFEEMNAASRAVTAAARERRLQLVDCYVQHLQALNEPNPFNDRDFDRAFGPSSSLPDRRSAFAWPGTISEGRRA